MKYRIGLDIGIGSCGWSVVEHDNENNPVKIVDMGVRVFDVAEIPKTGASTASKRREFRGIRRRRRRTSNRLDMTRKLIKDTFNIDAIDYSGEDIYFLRTKALDNKITDNEIARIIMFMVKNRGFRSTRKSELSQKDTGKMLKGVNSNIKLMEEGGYRTFAEMICKDDRFKLNINGENIIKVRNSEGEYSNTPSRKMLVDELVLILKKQKEFGNKNITKELIERFENTNSDFGGNLLWYQRPFDMGPDYQKNQKNQFYYSANFKVGNCSFELDENRAPKASYTFEYFSALQKINSLKIVTKEGIKSLDQETRDKIVQKALSVKELKYDAIRKLIPYMADEDVFNYSIYSNEKTITQSETKSCVSFTSSRDIKKAVGRELSVNELDDIALVLTMNKNDESIKTEIKKNQSLDTISDKEIEELLKLNFSKFGNLSIKAMKNIIPYLEEGYRYDEAYKKAGYNTYENKNKQKYLKGEEISALVDDINSPVVRRAVNQAIKVVNAIIRRYGSPQKINIELAREMSKTRQERNQIEKSNERNAQENKRALELIQSEYGIIYPKSVDILKLRLYNEQQGKCAYSQKPIETKDLFSGNNYQIDHAIPYSRSFDDSYKNKVLVYTKENIEKGNQTPYEYLRDKGNRWEEFIDFCEAIYTNNRAKKLNLTKKKWTKEDEQEFISRNLNDTKYISRFMLNLLQNYLKFAEDTKFTKKPVMAVNGRITSYLRRWWGLSKIREDGDLHHAIDACVIACINDGMIRKISQFHKYKENYISVKSGNQTKYVNVITGELIDNPTLDDENVISVAELEMFRTMPKPYPHFVEEIKAKADIDYNYKISDRQRQAFEKIGYEKDEIDKMKPVFVSRMKRNKTTGAIHEATLKSNKYYEETGKTVLKTGIKKVKYSNEPESQPIKGDKYPQYSIPDYFMPESDRLLYLAIKERLVESNNNPKEAFKEPLYKPTKSGKQGPQVKSVKIWNKENSVVNLDKVNASAKNDSMARIDVFKKSGKYYFIPVYMKDIYAKTLPNKICVAAKQYVDWKELDDSYEFLFSLSKNDLIRVRRKKELEFTKSIKSEKSMLPEKYSSSEILVYYISAGIATASIAIRTCDSAYEIPSCGIQNLLSIEKLYVDELGKAYNIKKRETREI